MEEGCPSDTAVVAAILRAVHPLLDSKPWILEDDLAAPLVGIDNEASLLAALNSLQEELARTASPAVVDAWIRSRRVTATLRARYVEDELVRAIERGVSQYVILGAGFDSFAYRRRDLSAALRVFEVDYPATQSKKQARLSQMHVKIPPHLTFVPLDFERQLIMDGLQATGYRLAEPAFFSWLGVTCYLTEEAVVGTLRQVASAAGGSEIVLDYAVPGALLDEDERQALKLNESFATARKEFVRSCFEPDRLAAIMREVGFAHVLDMTPEQANSLYLSGRTDELRFPPRVHMMRAQVES